MILKQIKENKMKVKVIFTASYETVIEVAFDQTIDDVISDIDVPENSSCKYVEDSFEVNSEEENFEEEV